MATAKRTAKKVAPTTDGAKRAQGQAKVIAEIARLVDAWRGFPLGTAQRRPTPKRSPAIQPAAGRRTAPSA